MPTTSPSCKVVTDKVLPWGRIPFQYAVRQSNGSPASNIAVISFNGPSSQVAFGGYGIGTSNVTVMTDDRCRRDNLCRISAFGGSSRCKSPGTAAVHWQREFHPSLNNLAADSGECCYPQAAGKPRNVNT
jgi:hypothetical protein